MSRTEQVRRALQELGGATARQVADHLQVQSRAQVEQVRQALKDLVRSGEAQARNYGPGKPSVYQWLPIRAAVRGDKQTKLWRAMQIKAERNEVWRVADVAMLAEAHQDYAKRYVRHCRSLGLVQNIPAGYGRASWYRLTPGHEQQEAPAWNRRAEKAKSRGQGPGARGQEMIRPVESILDEMRQTMEDLSGGAESVLRLVDELQAALGIAPGAGDIKETGHAGPDLDES